MEFFNGLFGKEKAPKQAEEAVPETEMTEEYPTAAGTVVEELPVEEIEIAAVRDVEASNDDEDMPEVPSTIGYEVSEPVEVEEEEEDHREAA